MKRAPTSGLLVLVVAFACATLTACEHADHGGCDWNGHHYALGDMFPEGDGCNDCICTEHGASCSLVACADANRSACARENACEGPSCGATCCKAGEHCDHGECRCGGNPGCGEGERCGGPVMSGDDSLCGTICCGNGTVCPL